MQTTRFEVSRRAHEHHWFRKPRVVWNIDIPDKREDHTEDAQESEWFRAPSTLCYRPPSTILVEDVVCDDRTHVQNKPRPQTRRYDKDSEADRWPGKMSGGLPREARDSGVVRRLELGIEGFWEFLYSDRWEDTCLLRVLHGALLDQLLTALYLLQRDHDVISYVTIAYFENKHQRLPCIRPTTAPQPDYAQDAEQVLVELDYFCSQSRPLPFSGVSDQPWQYRDDLDYLSFSVETSSDNTGLPPFSAHAETSRDDIRLSPSSAQSTTFRDDTGLSPFSVLPRTSRRDTRLSPFSVHPETSTDNTGLMPSSVHPKTSRDGTGLSAPGVKSVTFHDDKRLSPPGIQSVVSGDETGLSPASARLQNSADDTGLSAAGAKRPLPPGAQSQISEEDRNLLVSGAQSRPSDVGAIKESPVVQPQGPGGSDVNTLHPAAAGRGSFVFEASRSQCVSGSTDTSPEAERAAGRSDGVQRLPEVSARPRVRFSTLINRPASSLWFASETVARTRCNIRGMKKPPPQMHCFDSFHMEREPFMLRREREGSPFPPVILPELGLVETAEPEMPEPTTPVQETSSVTLADSTSDTSKTSKSSASRKSRMSKTAKNKLAEDPKWDEENLVAEAATVLKVSATWHDAQKAASAQSVTSGESGGQSVCSGASEMSLGSKPSDRSFAPLARKKKTFNLSRMLRRACSAKPVADKCTARMHAKRKGKGAQNFFDANFFESDEKDPPPKWTADSARIQQFGDDLGLMSDDLLVKPVPEETRASVRAKFAALRQRPVGPEMVARHPDTAKLSGHLSDRPTNSKNMSVTACVALSPLQRRTKAGTDAGKRLVMPPLCHPTSRTVAKGTIPTETNAVQTGTAKLLAADSSGPHCAIIRKWEKCPTFSEFYYYLRNEEKRTGMGEREMNEKGKEVEASAEQIETFNGPLFAAKTEIRQPKEGKDFSMASSISLLSTEPSLGDSKETVVSSRETGQFRTRTQKFGSKSPVEGKWGRKAEDLKTLDNQNLADEQREVIEKAGLIFSEYDPWHINIRFAYLAGGVCDNIGVRNALLQRRERIYKMIEDGKLLRRLQEARLSSIIRKVPKTKCTLRSSRVTSGFPKEQTRASDPPREPGVKREYIRDSKTVDGDTRDTMRNLDVDMTQPRKTGEKGSVQDRSTDSVTVETASIGSTESESDRSSRRDDAGRRRKPKQWDIEELRGLSDANLPDDLDEKTLFLMMGFQDVFDVTKLKNSYSFEKMLAHRQKSKPEYKKLLKEFQNPSGVRQSASQSLDMRTRSMPSSDSETSKSKSGSHQSREASGQPCLSNKKKISWSPAKDKRLTGVKRDDSKRQAPDTEIREEGNSPLSFVHRRPASKRERKNNKSAEIKPAKTKDSSSWKDGGKPLPEVTPTPPKVLGKLRDFRFLKYRDYMPTPIRVDPPRNTMTLEEMCDRLLQAMQMFVVRKERATTTRQFQSKASVTFTRRHVTGSDEAFMADARRVVAGACHTLRETGSEHGSGLVPY